jgi:acetyl-CoA carboxylase carboxyltransferase component
MGNSYGAGNYAMCGKAYDPRLIVAWPTAKIAVMGGSQAAKVLLQIQMAAKKDKNEAEEQAMFENIKAKYDKQTTPQYAAARLWVDAIIDPVETRRWISMGIEAANNAPIEPFNVGVIQA